jgi:hypothetical protein
MPSSWQPNSLLVGQVPAVMFRHGPVDSTRHPINLDPRHPGPALPTPEPCPGLLQLLAVPGRQCYPFVRQLRIVAALAAHDRCEAIPVGVAWAGGQSDRW